jgi:hypothetical protein
MTNKQKSISLNKHIAILYEKLKVWVQRKVIWIIIAEVFIIKDMSEFKMVEPRIKCEFIPITLDNCHRVTDFREEGRISQYRDKLNQQEIGYFAEHNGQIIGNVWAAINKTDAPCVVQSFRKIMYNEGTVHDNIVSEKFRGMLVGPFMETRMFELLLMEYRLSRIFAEVNVKNRASLRMLERARLRIDHRMLCVSLFGKPVLELVVKKYT